MMRNGKQNPARPQLELRGSTATPEEAAAIAAAIEQFIRDTTHPRTEERPRPSGWQRAALFEAVGLAADAIDPWGDPEPWGKPA
jgi:hypothetical protein